MKKNTLVFFLKPIDSIIIVCYNLGTVKERS